MMAIEGLQTDEEIEQTIMALIVGSGPEPVLETRIEEFVQWASGVKALYGLVCGIESGKLLAVWDEEKADWVFRAATDAEKAKMAAAPTKGED